MRKLLRKLRRVLMSVAVLAVAFLVYYGTRDAYHARVFIELVPGDAVLGDGRVAYGAYLLGGSSQSQYARDASGKIYLIVGRARGNGVLVFGQDGRYQREIRFKRLKTVHPSGDTQQLGVSPSGQRLWTVDREHAGLVVYCYTQHGKELQRWPAGQGRTQFFSAIGENSAYLWSGKDNLFAYTLGKDSHIESPFVRPNMWFAPDGWIWDVEVLYTKDGYSPGTVQIWKRKPGIRPLRVCSSVLPTDTDSFPFATDRVNNLYIWSCPPNRVYRILPSGQAQFVLDAAALIHAKSAGNERIGRMLFANDSGFVYFETKSDPKYTDRPTYRIYKAERIPRWRGWVLDLGWKP